MPLTTDQWNGIGLATSVAGALTSTFAAGQAAEAKKATISYEAAVAANNAKIAEYQAGMETQIGAQLEQNQRLKTASVIGSARAAMGANGVAIDNPGMGTVADVLATTEYMGERDALTIRDNSARRAWAYAMQAQNYSSNAAADRAMGDSISPGQDMIGSLLGSAGGVASSWKRYDTATKGVQK